MNAVKEIATEEDMRALLEESAKAPVVLFKYSPTCGISLAVQERWEAWIGNAPEGLVLAQCDVIGARSAARGVCEWTKVLHQSPQVMVFKDGACTGHTSHYAITADWLGKLTAG